MGQVRVMLPQAQTQVVHGRKPDDQGAYLVDQNEVALFLKSGGQIAPPKSGVIFENAVKEGGNLVSYTSMGIDYVCTYDEQGRMLTQTGGGQIVRFVWAEDGAATISIEEV